MEPGSVITPGGNQQEPSNDPTPQDAASNSQSIQSAAPSPVQQSPQSTPSPSQPAVASQETSTPAQENAAGSAQTDQHTSQELYSPPNSSNETQVTWSASEYISHQKTSSWYMGLGALTGLMAAVVFLVTKDWITLGTIIVVAILFGIFASRKPRVLQYGLDESGISIASRHYPYDEFRSFTVHDEGGIRSIYLLPMKRFMPNLSLYYPPDQEQEIIGTISNYLPHEERQMDAVDRLMKRVRF